MLYSGEHLKGFNLRIFMSRQPNETDRHTEKEGKVQLSLLFFFKNLIDIMNFINKLANPNVRRTKMHNLRSRWYFQALPPNVVYHYDNFWMRVMNFTEFKCYNFFITHSKKAIKFVRSSCDTISKQAVFPPSSSFQQRYSSHWDKQRSLCDINSSP